jgi:cob(I)alamin adenosyltransferase
VDKGHPRLEAYGALDELNAYLGWFRSRTAETDLESLLQDIQAALCDIGAHLATPTDAAKARKVLPALGQESVRGLEAAIDHLETELEPLTAFVLPGGTEDAAILHVARAVARRAEREVVRAGAEENDPLDPAGLAYLNRLSDLLFVMARVVNRRSGQSEPVWDPGRKNSEE